MSRLYHGESMKLTLPVLSFLLLFAGVATARQGDPRMPIFVRSAASVSGFTDPDKARRDSTRDLQNAFRNARTVRLAESEEQAIILLEVLGRETRREVNGYTFLTGQAQNKSVLMVRLTVGEFSTEFSADGGSSGMVTGYGRAAKKVAEQVERWVRENNPRLAEAMRARGAGAVSPAPAIALNARVELEGDVFVITNADRVRWQDVVLEVNGTTTVPGYRSELKVVEAGESIRIDAPRFRQADGLALNVADVHPVRFGILATIQGRPGTAVVNLD